MIYRKSLQNKRSNQNVVIIFFKKKVREAKLPRLTLFHQDDQKVTNKKLLHPGKSLSCEACVEVKLGDVRGHLKLQTYKVGATGCTSCFPPHSSFLIPREKDRV